jgi:hypothetical protein
MRLTSAELNAKAKRIEADARRATELPRQTAAEHKAASECHATMTPPSNEELAKRDGQLSPYMQPGETLSQLAERVYSKQPFDSRIGEVEKRIMWVDDIDNIRKELESIRDMRVNIEYSTDPLALANAVIQELSIRAAVALHFLEKK